MAHTTERFEAKRLYCEDGKTIKEVALVTGVNEKTLYRWKEDDEWDKDRQAMQLSGVSAYKSMISIAVRKLEEMATSGEINASDADALQKVVKSARSLSKDIDKRGNILLGIGEFVLFLRDLHPDQLEGMQALISEFGGWVKRKYP
jgi:transposase-like protein